MKTTIWYYNNGAPLGDIETIEKGPLSSRVVRNKLIARLKYYDEPANDAFAMQVDEKTGRTITHTNTVEDI